MKYILLCVMLLIAVSGAALDIVDINGKIHHYPYDQFFRIQAHEFTTSKELDKETVINTWKGIRFDTWLKEQNLGDFAIIKFKSNDRYEVSFNKAEWDTLTCYLAYSGEGEIFPKEQLRIIFPHLRSMHWVRDLQQVSLENHQEVPLPARFISWYEFFSDRELVKDPAPFVRIEGYPIDDFIHELSDQPIKKVILYSADGLIQSLSYPTQLAGAVLEREPKGYMNLKSPQIPGGMWMKNIIYMQVDNLAVISQNSPSALIPLAKALKWPITADSRVKLYYIDDTQDELLLGDALTEPMIFDGTTYFTVEP